MREFIAPDEVPAARVQRFLMLYVVGSGPEPVARRIDLRRGNVLGGATFRYRCEGWGPIQLDLGSVVDAGSELRRSHTNHSNRWPSDRNHVVGHDPATATIPADLQPWRDETGSAVDA